MSTSPSPIAILNSEPPNFKSDPIKDDNTTIESICLEYAHRVNIFLQNEATTPILKRVQAQTRITLGVIHMALEKYSVEELSLSYNGGKDCLVLLVLLLSALAGAGATQMKPMISTKVAASSKTASLFPRRLSSVYIMAPHSFPEVDEFVSASAAKYGLDLVRYASPMKIAFTRYLEEHKMIKAILVGTRRSDPHGKLLTHFDKTDSGWPSFMRVHPVIDWNYSEIWGFIRHLGISYCTLYDQGYTSLGGITDTHPNPALKINNTETYKPAYELVDDDAERLGRDDFS